MKHISLRQREQLGMSFGAACNRLRKAIMFRMLVRLGENVCFRCGKPINSARELSIDHKKAWLGIDDKLFWDLENIAFSHHLCNISHHRFVPNECGKKRRKIGPEGTAWCCGHKDFLQLLSFSSRKTKWNGVDDYCIECRSKKRSKGHHLLVEGKSSL